MSEPKYNDEGALLPAAIGAVLLDRARSGNLITYTELTHVVPSWIFPFDLHYAHHRAALGIALADVADQSMEHYGVMLPAIVIGKRDRMPSGDPKKPSGFWNYAQAKGRDISDPAALALKEQAKVFKAFQRS